MSTSPLSGAAPAAAAVAQVSVTINAEPETVWRFLSEQDKLLAWMTYIPGSPIPAGSAFEPRPGGRLRIIFPNGGEARGEVVEVEARKRLVFTWGYDPDVGKTGLGPGACRIEISMVGLDTGSTRVTLTHRGPMTEKLAKEHEGGWRHYLSQLALQSARAQHEPGLAELMRTYFAAWSEPDSAKRMELLLRCCDPGIRVRATFACTESLEEFNLHIANALRAMPGVALKPDGAPTQQHGFVRFGWSAEMAEGKRLFVGQNFARLTPAGRIIEMTGFQN